MNVWDLKDLKDDTLEMQEHVGEDIKQDLDKHSRGAHEVEDRGTPRTHEKMLETKTNPGRGPKRSSRQSTTS
jgi:hypothetical protein